MKKKKKSGRAKGPELCGVIHLPPLAGAPGGRGASAADLLREAGARAVQEAKLLTQAGFSSIILENFGDIPFYKTSVPPETIATMAIIAAAVKEVSPLPLGINVLRNDARAALAIAAVVGAQFIRVNVLSGLVATDQGLIEGDAAHLVRERERLAPQVRILADVLVKHGRTLSGDDLHLAIEEAALRAGAEGVIITGATTGRAASPDTLAEASRACRKIGAPLWIGSGMTPRSFAELSGVPFDGVIVGSALRRGGKAGAPLEPKRLREFVLAAKAKKR
jgi:membrane complex biogenesis BtpA family protein